MTTARWTHLDSVRGFAALAVVYFHAARFSFRSGYVSNDVEYWMFTVLTEWIDLGKVAVVAFFAVSGFVIPFSLLKKQSTPLRNFAISRFFRLYPAYWLSIPLALIFLFIVPGHPFTAKQVLANITMLQQFLGQENLLGVYWTLQIELIFYFISAIMFTLGMLHRPNMVALTFLFFLLCALAFAALRFFLERKVPVALPLGLTVMFWGLLWRYRLTADEATRDHVRKLSTWATITLVVLMPVISILAYNSDQGFDETWYRYTTSYYVALVFFAVFTSRIKVTARVFVYLGTISYSIYLFGPIAQEIAQYMMGVENLKAYPVHVVIVLTIAITIAMSAFVYHFVENPSRKLAVRLSQPRLADAKQTG